MTIANHWLWVVFDNLHALGEQQEGTASPPQAAAWALPGCAAAATGCRDSSAQLAPPPAPSGLRLPAD